MLFLQFKISGNSYILEARDIIEVVPYANLQRIPQAPDYLAGLLNYRGDTVPVVDICFLMSGKPCELKLSSRIAMIDYQDDDGRSVCIGLLIERLTETAIYKESDFSDSGVALEDSPYLGKVIVDDKRIIQLVSIREIIPEAAHDILFHTIPSGA
jgi:chemotaxis-related protein WspB